MSKYKFSQLELFSQEEKQLQRSFDLRYIKDYEKMILSIIFVLFIGIFSYCLGFKQGKKIALLNSNLQHNMPIIEKKPLPLQNSGEELKKKEEPELPSPSNREEKKEKTNYIIQLATYKTSHYAQREAEKLKKRGFNPLIINKDNYILLCVGSFINKKEAELVLVKLKKNYEDCFIRRF